VYDNKNKHKKLMGRETDFSSQSFDSSYYRISKTDGKVLEYVEFPSNNVDLTDLGGGNRGILNYTRIINCATGLFLCNPETDTVFLYGKDKTLTPVICKTPLVNKLDPKVILMSFVDIERYQFMQVQTLLSFEKQRNIQWEDQFKHYIYDKQTGEIFRQKISLPDYKGKDFFMEANKTYFNGKELISHFELDLFELKQAYRENKLSGKLKELVATLNENKDNNVYMLATFK